MGGKGSSPPPPPDYTKTAQQQGELNKQAVAQQIWANRPTQKTPWGGVDWSADTAVDPATGEEVTQWTQNQTLDPRLEASLDRQFDVGGVRSGVASDVSGQLSGAMGSPLDWDQFRDVTETEDAPGLRDRAETAMYDRLASRLDPQWNQAGSDMEIKLRNQGLVPGDEAYDRAMGNFNRAKTDAYSAAQRDAVTEGRAEAGQLFGQQQQQQAQSAALRQQEIGEALQKRTLPLDEINMLLAGQGVQPPSTPGYTSAGMASPADLMSAANATYGAQADAWNAKQAQRQGMMSGIAQGASMIPAAVGMFSDRRFKTNIVQTGEFRGYPWYQFDYVWGAPGEGVMADEVNPEAVTDVAGFAFVDYSRIA